MFCWKHTCISMLHWHVELTLVISCMYDNLRDTSLIKFHFRTYILEADSLSLSAALAVTTVANWIIIRTIGLHFLGMISAAQLIMDPHLGSTAVPQTMDPSPDLIIILVMVDQHPGLTRETPRLTTLQRESWDLSEKVYMLTSPIQKLFTPKCCVNHTQTVSLQIVYSFAKKNSL